MKTSVLFINGHLNTGGVEKSLVDILHHMDFDRYEVDLLLLEGLGDYAPELPPEVHVRLVDLHNTYGSLPKALLRCLCERDWLCLRMRWLLWLARGGNSRHLRRARALLFGNRHYDVVIGFRPGICTDIAAFAADADHRITWWHHGAYNLSGAAEQAYRLDCVKMDQVVSVSNSCAVFLGQHIPETQEKTVIIPNLLSAETIQKKAVLNSPTEKPMDTGLLVSVGRLSPEKHFENVVYTAVYLLEHGIHNFHWYVVGDGVERTRLEALAENSGVQEYVRFIGNQLNPYPILRQADLFVHPSYVESQGIVVLEAMALSVPCVVTRSLGPCEFIEDGVNGILTEQNPQSLSEKVRDMLTDRALYDKIKANTRCPMQFSPEQVMAQIEELLERKR